MLYGGALRKFLSAHTSVKPRAVSNRLLVPRLAHIYTLTAPIRGSSFKTKSAWIDHLISLNL